MVWDAAGHSGLARSKIPSSGVVQNSISFQEAFTTFRNMQQYNGSKNLFYLASSRSDTHIILKKTPHGSAPFIISC
jgi:hypothetical protein